MRIVKVCDKQAILRITSYNVCYTKLLRAVIPFGPDVKIFGYDIPLVVADVNIGVLFILALIV